ncbi:MULTISPECIES: hypothetical protein [unclassified Sulfurimonas]|uniref:hypothetical protein n=1 Tax=unclassified Sulfurimonas TaxID=2623549 RepID=UPI003204D37F
MKKFEDLDDALKKELEKTVKEDPFGLNAETLYMNIYNSSGPITTIAEIFEVKAFIVRKIKSGI